MTAITREYLDALSVRRTDAAQTTMIAALRRVLDLRDDYANVPHTVHMVRGLDAALAGTQTDDGAEAADSGLPTSDPMHGGARTVGAVGNHPSAPPVPSSPDRIDFAVQEVTRERIAQRIDQAWAEAKDRDRSDGGYRDGYLDGLEHAEGIARSTPLTGVGEES